jgi:SAM-dependent methyltransferase
MSKLQFKMVQRNCPLCGSADDSFTFAESSVDLSKLDAFAFASRKVPEYMHWRLVECRRCDLVYASPAPAPQSLHIAYEQASFDSRSESSCAAKTYADFLPRIQRNLTDLDGALDIGTGDGCFLDELLDAGFVNVIGVEPSAAPIAAAPLAVRQLIRHDVFRVADYAPESLRLVTCFQTLEHLSDPMAMCRDVFRLLKPGGAVFFVGHNRRAASARLLGRKSPIFDIEHLQLFSPASVRRLVTTAGFRDVEVGSILNRYPIRYWAKLMPLPGALKRGLLALAEASRVGRWALRLPAGNLFAIGYKPNFVSNRADVGSPRG